MLERLRGAIEREDYAQALVIAREAFSVGGDENGDIRGALHQIGLKLVELKQFEDASTAFAMRREFGADDAATFYNQGLTRYSLEDFEAAEALFRAALARQPDHADAARFLIRSLDKQFRFLEGAETGLAWLAEQKRAADGADRLRAILAGEPSEEALQDWTLASNREDLAMQRFKAFFSIGLLRAGRWREAWPLYEYRSVISPQVIPTMRPPEWRGRLMKGVGVVLYSEQGLGDTIMLGRFASMLGAQGANVFLMTQKKIAKLMSTIPNVLEAVPYGHMVAADRLEHGLLIDLIEHFNVSPEEIPVVSPYIKAEPDRVEKWRGFTDPTMLNIGIAWQGSRKNKSDRERSLPLSAFAPLAETPGVRLVSLQIGEGAEQIAEAPFGDRVVVPGPGFDDGPDAFLDTAALMESLDLVVCCDSAVGHLAGALGRPTFLALAAIADWRWLYEGETTGWYPSMRLFRQRTPGAWAPVMSRIAEATAQLASEKSPVAERAIS